MCVKELEKTSLVCGSDRDLESSDKSTPAPAVEPDLLQERTVLFDFLAKTIDIVFCGRSATLPLVPAPLP